MPTAATSPDSPAAPPRALTVLAVTALWAFIALTVIIMTAVGQSLKTGQLDLLTRFIWDAGWIGWAPLSFLVVALCRRYPIDRHHKGPSAVRLALLGVGVVLLQMILDALCITLLGWALRGDAFNLRTFQLIAIYKAHLYYGVYWMIVGAAHALEYHRRYRESELVSSQLETRLANAQLDRLKAQLQPHFLFNAHNTIVALMLKRENDAAIRMLTRLSDLLRISLSRSGQQLVPVRDELDTLRLYLDIQRERFRDRLTIEVRADGDVADAEIPHLVLQPLVENAFRHGLDDVSENARLDISVTRADDQLVCTVRDNGPGFPASRAVAATSTTHGAGHGIGLANTRERLRQLYGDRQTLTIKSSADGGCVVILRLPYRVAATSGLALAS